MPRRLLGIFFVVGTVHFIRCPGGWYLAKLEFSKITVLL
jgi:hypothetical protein